MKKAAGDLPALRSLGELASISNGDVAESDTRYLRSETEEKSHNPGPYLQFSIIIVSNEGIRPLCGAVTAWHPHSSDRQDQSAGWRHSQIQGSVEAAPVRTCLCRHLLHLCHK